MDLDNLQVHINALTTCLHHISGNRTNTSTAHEEMCQGMYHIMSLAYLHLDTSTRHAQCLLFFTIALATPFDTGDHQMFDACGDTTREAYACRFLMKPSTQVHM